MSSEMDIAFHGAVICLVAWLIWKLVDIVRAVRKDYLARRQDLERDAKVVQWWNAELRRLNAEYQQWPCEQTRSRLAVTYRRQQTEWAAFEEKYRDLLKTDKPSGLE